MKHYTLRMPQHLIDELEEVAENIGVPASTLARSMIRQGCNSAKHGNPIVVEEAEEADIKYFKGKADAE